MSALSNRLQYLDNQANTIYLDYQGIVMKEKYSAALVEFFERMSSWENGIVSDRDISLPQMHLLEVVGNNGSIRMKELSEKLGVTTGTLTAMIHRLLTRGYVAKMQDPEDKRSSFISLTIRGQEEYDYHHHIHGHLIDDIVATLGEKDSASFFNLLDSVVELM